MVCKHSLAIDAHLAIPALLVLHREGHWKVGRLRGAGGRDERRINKLGSGDGTNGQIMDAKPYMVGGLQRTVGAVRGGS